MRPHRLGLPVLLLPAMLVSMDLSILFVAGPTLSRELEPTPGQWLWIMDVYGFVMAGLLVTMGGVGDRIGRRRLLLIGAGLFGAASLAIAYAGTPELLIAGRALLGIGGATLAPSTLSLIRGMYADEDRRRRAVGAWTVAFTGGSVAGPVVGGLLLEHFWWGSVFLVNVPVMAVLVLAAPFTVPESRDPAPRGFDLAGAATSLAAVLCLVFAMKETVADGLTAGGAAAAVLGAVFALVFLRIQVRAAHPLVDLALFRDRRFAVAVVAATVTALAAAGLGVLAFAHLQGVHGLSPLAAALHALPTFAGTFAGAWLAGRAADRIRPTALLAGGLLATAAGFAVVAGAGGVWPFIAGYTVLTFGAGVTGTIAGSLILSTAPPERAGAAAGISETGQELGAALGIAVLGTIAQVGGLTTTALAAAVLLAAVSALPTLVRPSVPEAATAPRR
ncbi:MFS transporter [Nonomuraea longicatena]|uniref:MFS transporter n=1 Tax=Nonomuraea longicatena TaxID=83682 RepID=A0ABN1R2A3_9ACTN